MSLGMTASTGAGSISGETRPLRLLAIVEARTITGPAKNLIEFARTAREVGVETIVATFVRAEASNLFLETARGHSIEVHAIPERGAFDPAMPRRLVDTARRVHPDLIQTHARKSHFLARLCALRRVAPWIAFHHGYTWSGVKGRLYNELDRWSLRGPARVLTVSHAFAAQLQARGVPAERIDVVHNAIRPCDTQVSPATAAALRAQMNIAAGRKVILVVGRLSREKDHLMLLHAVKRLPDTLAPHLLIVGDGPERPRIEARIRALGMEDSVTLAGQQASVDPYYTIADVVAISSRTEGSPNALLEAIAAGVPVVATAVGGIPEIVTNDKTALLVDGGDAEGMAGAIQRVLEREDVARSLSAEARILVRERYSPEERARRLVGIYSEVCRRTSASVRRG